MKSTPSYSVKKISRHGINLFVFNAAEHQPEKKPFLAVVLRPTAQAIGLGDDWFKFALRRSRNEELTLSVREVEFRPTDFHSAVHVAPRNTRGTGLRPYQCLPVTKLEILLNGIDVERLKNPDAKRSILNMQKTVNDVIEHYYHRGGAVNKKAAPVQLEKIRDQLDQTIAEKRRLLTQVKKQKVTIENQAALIERWRMRVEEGRLKFRMEKMRADDAAKSYDALKAKHEKYRAGAYSKYSLAVLESKRLSDEFRYTLKDLKRNFRWMEKSHEGVREIPERVNSVVCEFLEEVRLCIQSVVEQRRLTQEFRELTLKVFPDFRPQEYDRIVASIDWKVKPDKGYVDGEIQRISTSNE